VLRNALKALYRILPASLLNRATNLLQPHFTVTVAAVILDETGRVLLLKHRFRSDSGWGIPGGFLAKGEQPEVGLRREIREEVALEIKSLKLGLVRAVRNFPQLQILYICRPAGELAVNSIEIEEYDWFPPDALPEKLSLSQRALIEYALSEIER
jgi:ADP-ribose pyrophosphatase YjhB (NUDIX family)